jgi:hypothetical protein
MAIFPGAGIGAMDFVQACFPYMAIFVQACFPALTVCNATSHQDHIELFLVVEPIHLQVDGLADKLL